MKKIKVLLLGAHINSSNLGCQALTYSIINLIETIGKQQEFQATYYVFEYNPNKETTKELCHHLGLNENQVFSYTFPFLVTLKQKIRNIKSIILFEKMLNEVDFAIDITAGDSFADIYGDMRFLATTKIKDSVEKKGVPLILAPQTYGPFEKKSNELYAARIIKNAYSVITRDKFSAKYVKRITGKNIPVTTDLAFQLPFNRLSIDSHKIKIGINISGLLVKDAVEIGFNNKNSLKTDYDRYLELLLKTLINDNKYEIYLIPHVEEDYLACAKYKEIFPDTVLMLPFKNPMDVKSFISGMDIFIGARMHATIGAFTSGVVTIPTAYSRKFETMFSVVDYDVIVDLQTMDTMSSLNKTIQYIQDYQGLKRKVDNSLELAEKYKQKTEDFFAFAIKDILGK